jgi:predicted kinase
VSQDIHIMTGLPASGKSTLARELGVPRFNLDDYRAMMGFTRGTNGWSKEKEKLAVEAMVRGAVAVAEQGSPLVIDNTHLNPRLPKLYKQRFTGLDVEFVVHDLTGVPIETCIERDAVRSPSVGENVIRKLADDMERSRRLRWRLTGAWMNDRPIVEPYVPDTSLPKAVVFDIDGTLSLHVARGPYDFDKVETDAVNEGVARILRMYLRDQVREDVQIIFLSGRKGEYREHTMRWLTRHELFGSELHMRPVGDPGRPDDVVKLELFNEHIRNRFNVLAVYDDRDRVVALWRRLGLTCLQVAYGAF